MTGPLVRGPQTVGTMSVFRIATLVVSAVSGGVFIGRKLLAGQVEKKKAALRFKGHGRGHIALQPGAN